MGPGVVGDLDLARLDKGTELVGVVIPGAPFPVGAEAQLHPAALGEVHVARHALFAAAVVDGQGHLVQASRTLPYRSGRARMWGGGAWLDRSVRTMR